MKILVVARYTTDRRSATVCHELNSLHDVQLFNLTWSDHDEMHPLRNMFRTGLDTFDFPQFCCHFDRPNTADPLALEMCLKDFKPDIVVLANEVYEKGVHPQIELCKKYGAKVALIAWQNTMTPEKEELMTPFIKKTYKMVDVVLCGANYTIKWHERFGKGTFVFAPFLAVKDGIFAPMDKKDFKFKETKKIRDKWKGKFVLSYAGRFLDWKIGTIPKALDMLMSKNKNICFFAVGENFSTDSDTDETVKAMRDLAKKYKDRIMLLPYAKHGDHLNEYFNACDMFLYPSIPKYGEIVEQVGVMHTDAGLCRKPCITSEVGGGPDVVLDEETGYLIDTTDSKNIVKAVNKYMKLNPSEKWKMQERAEKHCQRWLGFNIAERLHKVFVRLLEDKSGKREKN